jgi:uncharacterized protein (DUF433 family)
MSNTALREQVTSTNPEVVSTPGILGGVPCIRGTRIPASQIWLLIKHGHSDAEIHDGYPTLPKGSIEVVREWARLNPTIANNHGWSR